MLNHKASKLLLFTALFSTAFLERTVFHLGPNLEFVTTALILANYYLGRKQALLLTFLVMLSTDLIIGNNSIFIFTWSGFLIPAFFASEIFKKFKLGKIKTAILATGLGLTSNIFFYLWTNFGVWMLDSYGMYPKTLFGLLLSYLNAIPFLKNQLMGTALFIPASYFLIETIKSPKFEKYLNFKKLLGAAN